MIPAFGNQAQSDSTEQAYLDIVINPACLYINYSKSQLPETIAHPLQHSKISRMLGNDIFSDRGAKTIHSSIFAAANRGKDERERKIEALPGEISFT